MIGYVLAALSFWLFAAGVTGVLLRRSPLAVFMGVELMLNAANVLFVSALGRTGLETVAAHGVIGAFFVIAVAGAEVAVGLAVMVAIYRNEREVDTDILTSLRG